ncbi:MAG: hypothetical protein AAF756_10870 [Pseudomonadota bacterium]
MTLEAKEKLGELESEICNLAGALRGLGQAMITIGISEEGGEYPRQMEDFGYLQLCLGEYANRLYQDAEEALTNFRRGK